MWIVVCAICILASPFVGMFAALWAYGVALVRPALTAAGRQVADSLGYGAFVRTWASYIAFQRHASGRPGVTGTVLPTAALRSPALPPGELSSPIPAPPGYTPFCCSGFPTLELMGAVSSVTRVFNAGFAAGYMAGTVLIVATTFLAAPFLGAWSGGWQFFSTLVRAMGSKADGRILTDALGITEVLEQSTAWMAEQMASGGGAGAGGSSGPFSPQSGGAATPLLQATLQGQAPVVVVSGSGPAQYMTAGPAVAAQPPAYYSAVPVAAAYAPPPPAYGAAGRNTSEDPVGQSGPHKGSGQSFPVAAPAYGFQQQQQYPPVYPSAPGPNVPPPHQS